MTVAFKVQAGGPRSPSAQHSQIAHPRQSPPRFRLPAAAASTPHRWERKGVSPEGRGDERERVQRVQVAGAGGVESPAVHHAGSGPPRDAAPPPPHARGHAPPPLPPHRRAPHHAVASRNAHPGEAPRRCRDRGDVQRAEAGRGGEARAQTPARRLPPPSAAHSEAGRRRRGGCRCQCAVASGHQKPFVTVQQHNN